MANTIFLANGSATQGLSFWSATAGTVTVDLGWFKCATTATPAIASMTRNVVLASAGRRISFRVKTDTLPSAQNFLRCLNNTGASSRYALRLNTNGTLQSAPAGVTGINGATVLKVNTEYRIDLSFVLTSTTSFTINAYLNGKLEISHVNSGTLTGIDVDRLELGTSSTSWPANSNIWFKDIFVDDGTDLADPGNFVVTNKRPNANGAANSWTTQIGSGGSGYGTGHSPQVNEQPLSVTNGWSIASASLLTEEYTVESASTGDLDVSDSNYYSLVDYMGWVHAKVGSAGTRNIVVNGAASNISLTTTATTFLKASGSASYPSGNTAIGMNNNSVNNLTSLYECGILLAVKLLDRTADLSATLGAATLSATAAAAIAASASPTLDAATLSAAATVPIVVSESTTLDAGMLGAAATAPIVASESTTLADATLSSAVTDPIACTLSKTLADTAITAATSVAVVAAVSAALSDVTLVAADTETVAAAVSAALDAATLSASSSVAVVAAVSAALSDTTLTATDTEPVAANFSKTLDPATLSAAATTAIAASLNETLADVSLVSAVKTTSEIDATLNVILDAVTLSSDGSLSILLDPATLISAGAVFVTGQANIILGPVFTRPMIPTQFRRHLFAGAALRQRIFGGDNDQFNDLTARGAQERQRIFGKEFEDED